MERQDLALMMLGEEISGRGFYHVQKLGLQLLSLLKVNMMILDHEY
jgi:hypothetical protein